MGNFRKLPSVTHSHGIALVVRDSASMWKIWSVHVMVPENFYVWLNTLQKRDVHQNAWSPIVDLLLESGCSIVDIFLCPLPSLLVGSSVCSCWWNTSGSEVHHFLAQNIKYRVCLHHSLCLPLRLDAKDHTVLENGRNPGWMKPRSLMHRMKKPAHLPETLHGAVKWTRNQLLLSFWGLFVFAITW